MKKLLLALMVCSIFALSGCAQKEPRAEVPRSIKTYQKINFTQEQNKQIADIREAQRSKIEVMRKEMEAKRQELIVSQKNANLTDEQKRANNEKYRTVVNDTRVKLAAERVAYDNAVLNILDDKQKKIYKKYLDQREQERQDRRNKMRKAMPKKAR